MKTPLGHSLKLEARALTPVHIGGTESLSPLSDYYLINNEVRLIDADAFGQLLIDTKKIQEFVDAVRRVHDKEKTNFLRDFSRQHLKKELAEIPYFKSLRAYGVENPIEIHQCIKTDGKPYLPGSSVKGAIRSAILFYWLTEKSIPEKYKASQDALDKWWKDFTEYFYDDDLRKNQKVKDISKAFTFRVEEELFGKLNGQARLPMSCIKLTDTENPESLKTGVYGIERYNLHEGKGSIPVYRECIVPENATQLKVKLHYDRIEAGEEKYNAIVKPLTEKGQLFKVINHYSKTILKYELAVLDLQDVAGNRFNSYRSKMSEILERIEGADSNTAYLRLGQGKMMFYQTIGLALFKKWGSDEGSIDWIDYLYFCTEFNDKEVPTPYPSTRALTRQGQLPMGWIELKIV